MNREQQLAQILEGWLDGGLSQSEQDALLNELDRDPELRQGLAEQISTIGALQAAQDPEPRWLALFDLLEQNEPQDGTVVDFEQKTMTEIARISDRQRHSRTPMLAVAAALVLLLAVGTFLKVRNQHDLASAIPPVISVTPDPVAIVLDFRTESSESSLEIGSYLRPGLLVQESGWASIQTLHGVTVTLDAPFEAYLIAHDEIELRHGQARVHVPTGAEGFRLNTPAFDVLDLGTEFAVQVATDGTGRCRVFEGIADVSLTDSLGLPTHTRRLEATESIRIEPVQQAMQEIDEEDGDYPEIKLPPRPTLELASSYPELVLGLTPDCYWRFQTLTERGLIPNEVNGRQELVAKGSAGIAAESGNNSSGALVSLASPEFFTLDKPWPGMLQENFTISFFVQFEWLQNHAMISALKFSPEIKGQPFVLESYAAFRQSGRTGTGLHAVVRDPPGWRGGVDVFGSTLLRPRFWHHIAATRRGGELTLFLDGQVVGSESIGDDAKLDFDYFYVGRLNANVGQARIDARGMVGHIDELAIFGRALREEEIENLANGKVEVQ